MRLRDTDWAYLAGILDGEGNVAIYAGRPRIVVALRTEQPVKWIQDTFGGCYRGKRRVWANGRYETRYTWGVYSREWVWEILDGALPYLKLKHDRAKELMDHCASRIQS